MTPPPEFTHDAALHQIGLISCLARQLNATVTIDHHHTSKSIRLPVPTITMPEPGLRFMLRDNFHDLNLSVQSERDINLPLTFFYKPLTFDWYQEVMQRKRDYSFSDWTDEEMNDPRVLRVRRKNGNGWSVLDAEEKDRWDARASSTDWYAHDWSSGMLIASGPVPFADATVFYEARTAFGEGIPHNFKPYAGPCKAFMNAVNSWDELTSLCLGIAEHVRTRTS